MPASSAAESGTAVTAQAGAAAGKGAKLFRLPSLQTANQQDTASASQQPVPAPAAQGPAPAAQEQVSAETGNQVKQQGAPVAPAGRQTETTAEGFVAVRVARSSFHAAFAAPAAVEEVQAEQVSAALPALETPSPQVASRGGGTTAAPQDAAWQVESSAGATEGAPGEVPASGAKGEAGAETGAGVNAGPVPMETAQPEAMPVADPVVRGADRKELRTAQGARQADAAEKVVPEQAGVTQKAVSDDASGIKTASAGQAGKHTSPQGAPGHASGDAGGQGHSEQRTPGESGAAQSAALGVHTPAAEQSPPAEAKPAQHKDTLHQSILSQVKDGVVTHDGKGNGEMSIRLNPGELGELKIQVRMEDNRLRVEVQAENRMVKDLLMGNLESLKEALSGKNFTMEGFDVSTGGGGFNSPLPEERENPRQQGGFRFARAGGYAAPEERRVNYLTADVNTLLDVRF